MVIFYHFVPKFLISHMFIVTDLIKKQESWNQDKDTCSHGLLFLPIKLFPFFLSEFTRLVTLFHRCFDRIRLHIMSKLHIYIEVQSISGDHNQS